MPAVATDQEVVTLKEASELADVPVATLRFWIGRKEIWSGKRGDHRRVVRLAEVRERKRRMSEIVEEG